MVKPLNLQGRRAWLKAYVPGNRRFRLRLLDFAAQRLGVPALRPPPHPGGQRARDIERRRLAELAAIDVHVPEVLGVSNDALLLSDIGRTLASRLGDATDGERLFLVRAAAQALAAVHAAGGWIGQPLARNITVDGDGRVGFIDFEEDPSEVMPAQQAQVRDWLIFAAGVSRYFASPHRELADALREALSVVGGRVPDEVGEASRRLRVVGRIARGLGRRARRIAGAIIALRAATTPPGRQHGAPRLLLEAPPPSASEEADASSFASTDT